MEYYNPNTKDNASTSKYKQNLVGANKAEFTDLITRLFIEGSGIPEELFSQLAEFVRDTEVTIGGDVEYPIAELLNWKVPQRGQFWQPHKARKNQEAFIFRNADGSVWQAIVNEPEIKDGVQKRPYKYLAPTGNGNRLYFPPVEDWGNIKNCIDTPIVLTEGGKKTLAAIGQGYPTIGGYGCNCFVDKSGNLNPDLEPYAVPGREFTIALDKDNKPKTIHLVSAAIRKLGKVLTDRGCIVRVAVWSAKVAKGLDDLLVAVGAEEFNRTLANAVPYQQWVKTQNRSIGDYQARQRLGKVSNPDILLNTKLLASEYQLPIAGDVVLASAMGTGKTKLAEKLVKNLSLEVGVIALVHRVSLGGNLADRLGLDLINDRDNGGGIAFNTRKGREFNHDRVAGCIDSLLAIPMPSKPFILFFDEFSKVLSHLLIGPTCRKKRSLLFDWIVALMTSQYCVGVIAADADMTDREVDFIHSVRGERPTVVLNQYQETRSVRVIESTTDTAIIGEILDSASRRERLFIPCSQKSSAITIDTLLKAMGVTTLLLHSDNTGEAASQEFRANPDRYLATHKPQVLIASPTIAEGVSITGNHFDRVYGVFNSKSIDDASVCQFLRRYRPTVPMTIWVHQGSGIPQSVEQLKRTHRGIGEFTLQMAESQLAVQWEGLGTDLAYQYLSDREYSLANLQAFVIARLESQGYQVEVEEVPHDRETAKLIEETQKAAREKYHQDVAAAKAISEAEALDIECKIKYGKATEQERLEVIRHILSKFYVNLDIDPDAVAFDKKGKTRSAVHKGEVSLLTELANNHDREKIEELQQNGGTILPTDLPNAVALNQAFSALGLEALLTKLIQDNFIYSQYDPLINDIADRARACALQVRELYGFTPIDRMSATDIVGRLLSAIGFKTKKVGHLTDPETGVRTRYYSLDWEHFDRVAEILRRRHDRRIREGFKGLNTHLFNLILKTRCAESKNSLGTPPPLQKMAEPPPDRSRLVAIT